MPSPEWNKQWTLDLKRFLGRRALFKFYGQQWGDPDVRGINYLFQRIVFPWRFPGNLSRVVDIYIRPYVTSQTVVLEIGAGGGRWTKYLLEGREVLVVDLNPQFFDYLRKRFEDSLSKLCFYQTTGYEMDGIDSEHVDFLFTFGSFVNIDPEGIDAYLTHIKRILKPGAVAVIQYADKKKLMGRINPGFSNMNHEKMEELVLKHGFGIVEHDLKILNHSNIVVIRK